MKGTETMEELRKYNESSYTSTEDIANAMQKLSEAPAESFEDLENAVYHLQTIAQNKYNSDFYRVFFNVLAIIAEKIA